MLAILSGGGTGSPSLSIHCSLRTGDGFSWSAALGVLARPAHLVPAAGRQGLGRVRFSGSTLRLLLCATVAARVIASLAMSAILLAVLLEPAGLLLPPSRQLGASLLTGRDLRADRHLWACWRSLLPGRRLPHRPLRPSCACVLLTLATRSSPALASSTATVGFSSATSSGARSPARRRRCSERGRASCIRPGPGDRGIRERRRRHGGGDRGLQLVALLSHRPRAGSSDRRLGSPGSPGRSSCLLPSESSSPAD